MEASLKSGAKFKSRAEIWNQVQKFEIIFIDRLYY